METKNWIMIGLGILIVLGIYFSPKIWEKIRNKKSIPPTSSVRRNTPTPATGTNHTVGNTTHKTESKFKRFFNTTFGIMALILMGTLVIVALAAALLWFSHFDEKWGNFFNPPRPTYHKEWVAKDSLIINFNAKYGEPTKISEGDQLSFKHESGNFCVKNRDSTEVCGTGKEVGQRLPNTKANTLLWFKSCDSLPGKVTIFFWTQRTVKD